MTELQALIGIITTLITALVGVGTWLSSRAERRTLVEVNEETEIRQARESISSAEARFRTDLFAHLAAQNTRLTALEAEYYQLWGYVRQLQDILRENGIPVPVFIRPPTDVPRTGG